MHMADPLHRAGETSTPLSSNHTPIKENHIGCSVENQILRFRPENVGT